MRPTIIPLACLATLLAFVPLRGQERGDLRLSGVVTAAEDGEPLEGAIVRLLADGREVLTGSDGSFAFEGLGRGAHTVRVSFPGRAGREETVRLDGGARPPVRLALAIGPAFVHEEVVVTATRGERPVFEVPAPVSVVDRQEIEESQADAPGELFPREPGVEVEGSGPFLGRPVIRGLAGNRVLVLVDGQRLNNAREAINFGGVEPSLVDLGWTERIEITRGPASVLYGSDALGGIVNVLTREPPRPAEGLAVGGRVRPRYSTADEQRAGRLELDAAGPRWSLRVGGGVREAEDFSSARGEVENSGAETHDLNARLAVEPAEGHRLLLDLQRFRGTDVGVPGTGGVFTGFYPRTSRDKVGLRYEAADLAPWVASLQGGVYVQDQEEDFSTVLDLPPIPAGPFSLLLDTETSRVSDVRTVGFDVQARQPVGAAHLLTAGVEVFRDDVEERRREVTTQLFQPTVPGPPPATEVVEDTAATTPDGRFGGVGVYLQDEVTAGAFTLIPGVRYDRFDIETEPLARPEGGIPGEDRVEDAVSASLGALARVTEGIHATASVGRAFRTPNLIERYFFGPGSQGGLSVPNPDLENETSLNVDVGAKVQGRGVRGSLTYFRNRIHDFITFVPATFEGDSTFGGQPITTVDNVGDVRIHGVEGELEVSGSVGAWRWNAFGVATWSHGRVLGGGDPVFVPPPKLVAGLRWSEPGAGVALGLVSRFVDRQERVPEGFTSTPGFGVLDVHGTLDLTSLVGTAAILRAGVENVTDKAYSEPLNANLSPGRSLVLSVEYAFGSAGVQ
ncbi:MAG TPA: TonB-dependent receptor [Gemmatimonadota bacterium]